MRYAIIRVATVIYSGAFYVSFIIHWKVKERRGKEEVADEKRRDIKQTREMAETLHLIPTALS